jgi:negative regulator of sigma E activity
VTPSRTVIVGSALPLLILIGLVGFPSARAVVGLDQPEPSPVGGHAIPLGSAGISVIGTGTAAAPDEALSLARLRRSITAGRTLAFTGTEIVSAWHLNGSRTQVLELVQGPDGVRTATARDVGTGTHQVTGLGTNTDALAGLSERALAALAAGYELRTGGRDQVAGRAASVVVAAREGRDVARMWLDDRTGLLLRQDVLDSTGRLHRMAAFVDLTFTGGEPAGSSLTAAGARTASAPALGRGGKTVPVVRRFGNVDQSAPAPASAWSDVVSPTELSRLRSDGWPCPLSLPVGFTLLDARRTTSPSGTSTLHLTYGDGLSAISVFLQRGRLDATGLTGLTSRKWGDTDVYVRDGWPEVMVWQGGPMVITAVADAEPTDLRTILSALPRQSNHGTLGSLQDRMGSALAWLRG